ncbi:MAG: T9SS type A sorting domain-containing protein [Bacteroidota bacterium]
MNISVPSLCLCLFVLLLRSTLHAQPINDECSAAIFLPLAEDRLSCQQIAGTTFDATGSQDPRSVCSTSWFGDDVWYAITTGDAFPTELIVIRCYFGGEPGDLPAIGMAIYPSCATDAQPLTCYTTTEASYNNIKLFTNELETNTTYYIRLWSGFSGNDHSGTFRICAYQDNVSLPNPVFWEATFDEGLGDWEVVTDNELADTSTWRHTTEASQGRFGQHRLLSPTAGNGWMLFDADYFLTKDSGAIFTEPPWPVWRGELISPVIDCSNEENVKLQFWQYARMLFGETSLCYSLNGGATWSAPIEINADLPASEGTPISDSQILPLPMLDDQERVRLKFVFAGDFYVWLIDDVRLMGKVPNSKTLDMFDLSYPENIQTPVHQVAPIRFASSPYHAAAGLRNINFQLAIEDPTGSSPYFSTQLHFDTIANINFDDLIFPDAFTPKSQLVTSYQATYTIRADGVNFDPDLHQRTYTFFVTDSTYAREDGPNRSVRPADGLFAPQTPHSYAMGNSFYVHRQVDPETGQRLHATSVSFQLTNLQEHRDKELMIKLYEWEDRNGDQLALLGGSPDELTLVGLQTYTPPQNASDGDLGQIITIPLAAFPGGTIPYPPALREGKNYLAVVEYNTNRDNDNIIFEASETFDYSQTIRFYEHLNEARYTHVLKIGGEDYFRAAPTADLNTTNLGHNVTPLVRLNVRPLDATTSTVEQLPQEHRLQLFPNPVQDQLFVDLALETTSDVLQISILNVEGKVMMVRQYPEVREQRILLNVRQLPSGSYWLRVDSQEGQRSNKFVVQR